MTIREDKILRTADEIAAKILELKTSSAGLQKGLYVGCIVELVAACALVGITIVSLVLGIMWMCLFSIISILLFFLALVFISRWLIGLVDKRDRRYCLALALERVLEIMNTPGGEDELLQMLDDVIRKRNAVIPEGLRNVKYSKKHADAFFVERWVEALSWAASPDGVQESAIE